MKTLKFNKVTQSSFFDSVAFDWIVFASAVTCLGFALMAALSTGLAVTDSVLSSPSIENAVIS